MRDLKALAGRARAGPVSDFLVPATILAQHGPNTALPAQQQRGFGSLEQGEHIGVSHVSVEPIHKAAMVPQSHAVPQHFESFRPSV